MRSLLAEESRATGSRLVFWTNNEVPAVLKLMHELECQAAAAMPLIVKVRTRCVTSDVAGLITEENLPANYIQKATTLDRTVH